MCYDLVQVIVMRVLVVLRAQSLRGMSVYE